MYEVQIALPEAQKEVEKLYTLKKILPKRREALSDAADYIVEAVSLGYVTINEDGTITQKLIEPLDSLTELKYAARIPAATIQGELAKLANQNVTTKTALYIRLYTSSLTAQVNKLEASDRNIADAVALFFM